MLVLAPRGHEHKLRFSELAHRLTPQFSDLRCDSSLCRLESYTNRIENWGGDCANSSFFFNASRFHTGSS
jgi:hypothetical protein